MRVTSAYPGGRIRPQVQLASRSAVLLDGNELFVEPRALVERGLESFPADLLFPPRVIVANAGERSIPRDVHRRHERQDAEILGVDRNNDRLDLADVVAAVGDFRPIEAAGAHHAERRAEREPGVPVRDRDGRFVDAVDRLVRDHRFAHPLVAARLVDHAPHVAGVRADLRGVVDRVDAQVHVGVAERARPSDVAAIAGDRGQVRDVADELILAAAGVDVVVVGPIKERVHSPPLVAEVLRRGAAVAVAVANGRIPGPHGGGKVRLREGRRRVELKRVRGDRRAHVDLAVDAGVVVFGGG